ncbi:MAG: hypothetical protein AAB732_00005 [Patescibacteria group bacterium]
MSWKFVITWTKSPNQNFEEDNRGWQKKKVRTHTEEEKQLTHNIRNELKNLNKELYIGPKAILKYIRRNKQKYKNDKNVNINSINISFIINTLKELGLSKPHKKKTKGCSQYQHYPKLLINQIGELILEIDFIQRFIKGQTEPIHFIGFSCKKLNFRQYKRISAQTNINVIKALKWFFDNFFIPDVIKMDNDPAFIGSNSAKRTISQTIKFLFYKKVISIFTNPRNPWNNGSIEGSNSVFARNFWNKFEFNSTKDIDLKLKLFNQSSLEYSDYEQNKFQNKKNKSFIPQIYFIRKVQESQKNGKGEINILNDKINIPDEYINLYTLSQWNLKTETLYVYFEKEQMKILIKKIKFQINKNCKINI